MTTPSTSSPSTPHGGTARRSRPPVPYRNVRRRVRIAAKSNAVRSTEAFLLVVLAALLLVLGSALISTTGG